MSSASGTSPAITIATSSDVGAEGPSTDRLFGLVALARPKSLALRLLELVVLYFLVGGAGLLLERRAGQIAPQGWEFYAVTGALFLTLAFPGFVWRYLLHRRH